MKSNPVRQSWWRHVFPKVHYRWKEPKPYLRLKDKSERPKLRRLQPWLLLGLVAVSLLQWALATAKPEGPELPFEQAVLVVLVGSAALVYGAPWLIEKCPSEVRVSDSDIWRLRGDSVRRWKVKNLTSYRWLVMSDWALLELETKSAGKNMLAVPFDVHLEDLDAFLQQCGLRKVADAQWSEFQELSVLIQRR